MLVIASVNESKANILAHLEPIDAVMGSIINLLTTSEFKTIYLRNGSNKFCLICYLFACFC